MIPRGWRLMAGAALCCAALAQHGTAPREKPADYPAHAEAGGVSIAAEYLVRSFSIENQTFVAQDHLVVEVALYPPQRGAVAVSAGRFALRLNGKKTPLMPQPPGFVAAALRYPDWDYRPRLEAGAGVGDAGVILGRPQPVERFPGDRRPAQTRLPAPPRAPASTEGVEKREPVRPDEAVVRCALPEGEAKGPVSGYLYFAYKGKPKSVKSVELIYRDGGRETVLRLL